MKLIMKIKKKKKIFQLFLIKKMKILNNQKLMKIKMKIFTILGIIY